MALKRSKQREAIKSFLQTRKDHPTADVVYMEVKKEFPNISLGTVYRNLSLLADTSEISRINVGDGIDHFDPDVSPHYHFICKECGSVKDMDYVSDPMDLKQTMINFDGQIEGRVTYFYGVCSDCLKEKVRNERHEIRDTV